MPNVHPIQLEIEALRPTAPHWHLATCAELTPLIAGHYSRRHPPRPGTRLGGIGSPLYLATELGSAWIAVWQVGHGWNIPWRSWPSWWVSLFRRQPAEPSTASELVKAASALMHARRPGPAYTAVNLRKIHHTRTPGRSFRLAGWTPLCSTRPQQRSRSLLILLHC